MPEDRNRIHFACSLATGEKVCEWARDYNDRMDAVEEVQHIEDQQWETIVTKIRAWFITRNEIREAIRKMKEIKYTDIESFLLKMSTQNIKVKVKGMDYRDMLEQQLPWAIRNWMVSRQKLENDEKRIEKLCDEGKLQGEFERKTKYLNKGLPLVISREKATDKREVRFKSWKFERKNRPEATPP